MHVIFQVAANGSDCPAGMTFPANVDGYAYIVTDLHGGNVAIDLLAGHTDDHVCEMTVHRTS